MRRAALILAGMLVVMAAAASAGSVPLAAGGTIPRARALAACAGAGAYWPTMTLAVRGSTAWVACKEQNRIVRISLPAGRKTATARLPGAVIAVAIGYGSVWALDDRSTLYRIDPRSARVRQEIALGTAAAYNIWIGAGAVWVADDQGAQVVRISPSANKVIARIPVGDGPADMVFAGHLAWVVAHRDNTLFRIDAATNGVSSLATVAGGDAAAERLALLGDSLWITGRGMPLLEVDPNTGATRRSVDIHGTGIDVVATANALWVPVRTDAVDRTGFPTMTAVRRVTATGDVNTVATARGRVDVHGLASGLGSVWLADNTRGFLYRLPA
jgi:hypothetical protein